MNALTACQLWPWMAAILFLIGLLTFLAGLILLIARTWNPDLRLLANQTARLAQKGLAEDLAGLIGNANLLIASLNELVRTTAGVGVFLLLLGLSIMGLSFYVLSQAGLQC